MGKQKTRKSAAKRFKVSGKGKLLHRSPFYRHLRSSKNKRQMRRLKQLKQLTGKFKSKMRKMLGI